MNKDLIEHLYSWPKVYIFLSDLQILLQGKSPNALRSIIKRATQKGYLLRLKRDLYLIPKRLEQAPPNTLELAPLLYGPSYISFESALSYHGWIPEAVMATTSACIKRTKEFASPVGFFSYLHIPASIYSVGIKQISSGPVTLFIADPWKALADLSYSKKRFWASIKDLEKDLRIEPESLNTSDKQLLHFLSTNYPHQKIQETLQFLEKELSHDY